MRFADDIPLHPHYTFHKMVQSDIVNFIIMEVVGNGESAKIGEVFKVSPKVVSKR